METIVEITSLIQELHTEVTARCAEVMAKEDDEEKALQSRNFYLEVYDDFRDRFKVIQSKMREIKLTDFDPDTQKKLYELQDKFAYYEELLKESL